MAELKCRECGHRFRPDIGAKCPSCSTLRPKACPFCQNGIVVHAATCYGCSPRAATLSPTARWGTLPRPRKFAAAS